MTQQEIISGSKLIAEYLGFVYLPFSAELKEKSLNAGWYEVIDATANIQEVIQTSYKVDEEYKAEVKKIKMNVNILRYNNKNGLKLVDGNYYKYICRHHSDLKYYNSLDSLIPVMQKIEKECKGSFRLNSNGCHLYLRDSEMSFESYTLPTWSNNVFSVIIYFLTEKV